jgi:hypothetical protein
MLLKRKHAPLPLGSRLESEVRRIYEQDPIFFEETMSRTLFFFEETMSRTLAGQGYANAIGVLYGTTNVAAPNNNSVAMAIPVAVELGNKWCSLARRPLQCSSCCIAGVLFSHMALSVVHVSLPACSPHACLLLASLHHSMYILFYPPSHLS